MNLLDVSDNAGLVRRVREARDRLPARAWLIGGEWGAYEEWAMGSTGASSANRGAFSPHRAVIDSITPATPAILAGIPNRPFRVSTRRADSHGMATSAR